MVFNVNNMEQDIDRIVFLDDDNPATIATKTVLIHAGSSSLKTELKKQDVEYVKVIRGLNTYYILTSPKFGRVQVKL